jgi:histidyl-tRNA synthetase
VNEFQKKLAPFIRKNISSFSADLRQALKKDPFAIFNENKEKCGDLQIECPKSMDFLSESSRLHFKEVLEFLEIINIPYQINQHLIGDPGIGSETVFSIKNNGEELAYGFRFNRLAKKIGCKKDLPATVLNISARLKKNLRKAKVKVAKPQFYLVQFGPEAKLKSFTVLDELHKAGAGVIHSIAKDKLGSQMSMAEISEAPYIILIGQKEALENSIIIRNNATRAQEIVSLSEFPAKIKELI